jgi:hypothetical protein
MRYEIGGDRYDEKTDVRRCRPAADSVGLRQFSGNGLDEETPNHSTISRTRRLIDVETHRKVFLWVLGVVADRGLLKGPSVGVDATTLEAMQQCNHSPA